MPRKTRAALLLSAVLFFASTAHAKHANVSGHWSMTGRLHTARHQHAMVLLPDGRVLIAGGMSGTRTLASSEIYDPRTGKWSVTGTLALARSAAPAVLLNNGKVLLAGGCLNTCDEPSALAELYDPSTGSWSQTRSLNTARYFHTATLLQNGQVLVAGGCDSSNCATQTATAELYDPDTGTWSYTAALSDAPYRHTASLLANGQVLVAGGYGAGKVLATTEIYDPGLGTWSSAGDMEAPRYLHTATLLNDGTVMVVGGRGGEFGAMLCTTEVFDPSTLQWTYRRTIGKMVQEQTASLLSNGMVLVAAGTGVANIDNHLILGSKIRAQLYSPRTGSWLNADRLNHARTEHTAVRLNNGDVLVAGGINSNGTDLATAEVYQASQ